MIDLLTNHPEISDVKRKAFCSNLNIDYVNKVVQGVYVVEHYESDNATKLKGVKPVQVVFWITNRVKVDVNGLPVPEKIEDTDEQSETFGELVDNPSYISAKPEFDHVFDIVETAKSMTLTELVDAYIPLLEARGNFGIEIY